MNERKPPRLTIPDRVRAWFSADYAAQAVMARHVATFPWRFENKRRGGVQTRLDEPWSSQPWGTSGTRTLSPSRRREMVRRSREIDEGNMLGSSLLDRAADNVIGEGLTVVPQSSDDTWNKAVTERLKRFADTADARGMMSLGEMERAWYRASKRDGDVGVLLMRRGQLRTIESDYVQTPSRMMADLGDIVDGVELGKSDQPIAFYLNTTDRRGLNTGSTRVAARNFGWVACNDRNDRGNVRGVPVLAQHGWILDQIEGTLEAVTVAHRMSALFGLILKKKRPGAAFGNLVGTVSNADGDDQKKLQLEPGMAEYIDVDEDIEQIKPQHPTANLDQFINILVRFAGLKLGLPFEIGLLDFSHTNYSSARASMEQAYRRFRIDQRKQARLRAFIYRWDIRRGLTDGELESPPTDLFAHQVYGQPWPYLDPVKDAEGDLLAVDAGHQTQTQVLAKRGMQLDDWIRIRRGEIDAMEAAGIQILHSNKTRDAGTDGGTPGTEPPDEDQ